MIKDLKLSALFENEFQPASEDLSVNVKTFPVKHVFMKTL